MTPLIPDLLPVTVPVGGRVVVLADLHLREDFTTGQLAATGELATAIEATTGPGVLIIAGNLFDSGVDPQAALTAQCRLVRDIAGYAVGAGPSGGGPSRRPGYAPGLVWPRARLPSPPNWAPSWRWPSNCRSRREPAGAWFESSPVTTSTLCLVSTTPATRARARTPSTFGRSYSLQFAIARKDLPAQGPGGFRGWSNWTTPPPSRGSSHLASPIGALGRSAWLLLIPFAAVLALRLPSLALRSAWAGALTTPARDCWWRSRSSSCSCWY